MASPGRERRRFRRIKRPCIARVRICRDRRTGESHKWDIVTIRNLSAGGISFNCDKKIAAGTGLELIVELPLTKESVRCFGVVCRTDEIGPPQAGDDDVRVYGIAARFTEVEKGKEKILETIGD